MAHARQLAEPQRLFDFGDSERRYSRRPYLVFDVGTSGCLGDMPEGRVVRLAWGLYDARGRERAFHDAVVAPDGFEISAEATRVHGISTARARREGRPLVDVVAPFVAALLEVRAVVAHGLLALDWSVVGDEIDRVGLAGLAYGADVDAEDTSTMMRAFYPGADWRLPQAYHHVLGRPMPGRRGDIRDAADDARACAALYFALRSRRRYRRIRAQTGDARAVDPPAPSAIGRA